MPGLRDRVRHLLSARSRGVGAAVRQAVGRPSPGPRVVVQSQPPDVGRTGKRPPRTSSDIAHALQERVKELDTLLLVSEQAHVARSPADLMKAVVEVLPRGWQYPDMARARVSIDGQSSASPGFAVTPWMLTEEIQVGESVASVQLAYLREAPAADEGPFLHEERQLLRSVASEIKGALQRLQLEASLRHWMTHDRETGLLNRPGVTRAISQRAQADPERPYAHFIVDVGRMWEVNQRFGYERGFEVIREVADRLSLNFGPIVSRERRRFLFVVDDLALEDIPTYYRDVVAPVLEQDIVIRVAEGQPELDARFPLDFAVSAAHYPTHSTNPEMVAALADAAAARTEHGFRRFVLADVALDGPGSYELERLSDIRAGAARGDFFLVYQPRVSRDGVIDAVEALIRWNHRGRVVGPAEFLDLAEPHGLVRDVLTPFVCFRAFNQVASWRERGLDLRVAVNISASSLMAAGFVELLMKTIELSGISPRDVEVEVTESAVLTDIAHATTVLSALRAAGVTVALDDFGTGHSSLALLERLPIDVVKVDRSFVSRAMESPTAAAIVTATVGMAKAVGAITVAEGVEDLETAHWLLAAGADSLQGYYFAKPLHPDDLATWQSPGLDG